jgi:hypothetical protein
MIRDTLGKLSDTGPPLAIRKELRDVAPDLKSFYARLEKSTGVSGWVFEIEVPCPMSDTVSLRPTLI